MDHLYGAFNVAKHKVYFKLRKICLVRSVLLPDLTEFYNVGEYGTVIFKIKFTDNCDNVSSDSAIATRRWNHKLLKTKFL